MSKPLIIANWKCNPTTFKEAKLIFNGIKKGIKSAAGRVGVVICPPFVYLSASAFAKGYGGLAFGSQDCFWEEAGAFTGEISPLMLKNLGVKYVILGHSERRKYQKETDKIIEKKLRAALKAGLKPILCIDKISQIPRDIENWKLKIENLVIAHEPLFAIGTGKACSIAKAKKMKNLIQRKAKVPVLYGGSVNSQNAKDYIKKAGFDGLLIGGASLKTQEFIDIIKAVC